MTPLPFHDSAHNMYENSQTRSSCHSSNGSHSSGNDLNQLPSNTANVHPPHAPAVYKPADVNLFKVTGTNQQRFPNSSVFLENSDILDDKDYPQVYKHHNHRHSTIAMPQPPQPLDQRGRRSSDTRLMHTASDRELNMLPGDDQLQPIFNMAHVLGVALPSPIGGVRNHTATSAPTAPNIDAYGVPQITEIDFDNIDATYDPLELSIHEMLDADDTTDAAKASAIAAARKQRLSLHTVNIGDGIECNTRTSDNRNFFKSLPNLSASSENLLQK